MFLQQRFYQPYLSLKAVCIARMLRLIDRPLQLLLFFVPAGFPLCPKTLKLRLPVKIVILVFLIKKGTVGPNRFGPDPLQQGYFNPSFAPQGFNPQYGYGPQGFDPSQVPQGYNPQNYQGYGPQGGPQGYNPQYGPQGYGPQGFDPNQAPNGAWPQQGQWQQPQGQWQQPNGWQQQGNWQPPQGTPQDYGQQAPQGYEQPSAHNFGGNGAPEGSHSIYPQAEQGMYAPPPAPPEQDSDPKRPQ